MDLNKRIVYKNLDGKLSIIIPTYECLSLDELIKCVPEKLLYKIIDSSDIPSDRTFRDAWELLDD